MNLTVQDFARLRWSLIFLASVLAIGAALLFFSRQQIAKGEQTHRLLSSQQQQVRSRLNHAREEEQEIRGRVARYQKLRDSGVIGQEDRLNWVEQIARIKAAHRLLDLQYELSPQHRIDDVALPGGPSAGGYLFMASTMKLQMSLLHEDDLLVFLADLRKAVHAHLLVRNCSVERASGLVSERGPSAQLRAECTIDWVTLAEEKP